MTNAELLAYRDAMEFPMEALACALWGLGGDDCIGQHMKDHEIVEFAGRKIKMLADMLAAQGVDRAIIKLAVSA